MPTTPSPLERRFRLLASAIAARPLAVSVADTELVYTDGRTIYLPVALEEADLSLPVVIQGALLGAGSFDPQLVVQLAGRHTAGRRYLTLEAARATDLVGDALPRAVEDAVAGHWSGRRPGSAHDSLERALNGERIPPAPPAFGAVRPKAILRGASLGAGSLLSRRLRDACRKAEHVRELDDDEDSQESDILNKLSAPMAADSSLSRILRRKLGAGRRPKAEAGASGAELPVAGDSKGGRSGPLATYVTAPSRMVREQGSTGGRWVYPEWHAERSVYRPDWCHVGEFDPQVGGGGPARVQVDCALRRKLGQLGLAYRRHGRRAEGEDLDIDALVDFAVDRRTGATPDGRVYQERLRTERDLGVLVLVDASGSTAQRRGERGPIWNDHQELAVRLVGELEQVGDRVAAFAFQTRGRHNVNLLRVKDWDGRLDRRALQRLSSIEPTGFTRLGAAVRHGTHLVATQSGAGNRLLVVVSDGFAYDEDYERTQAEQDTRRALDEAVRRGIGCVCLSIGSPTDEATLERTWGIVTHVRLPNAAAAAACVLPAFRSALDQGHKTRAGVH